MKQLLLLHGALGSASSFAPLQAALKDRLNTHALDFPGHGDAPAGDAFTIPLFADAVLQWLDARGLERTTIFGFSMGGYVALYLASRYPERVESVITLGTKLDWTPESAARESALLNAEKIESKVPQFAQLLRERHRMLDWKTVLQRTAALLHTLGNGGALTQLDFEKIICPVRITRGALDNMVSETESLQVAGWIPGAQYVELPDTKHPLEQVDPALLAQRV